MNCLIKSIKRLYHATIYSLDGLITAFKNEQAFRLEIYISFILIPTAIYLKIDMTLKLWLISSWFLVIIFEVINSAIESVVDRISLDRHQLAKQAKDLGSAAVMLAIIHAAIIWSSVISKYYN